MRIIAGTDRGRKLVAPPGRDTRPILDSLKEALFNIIQREVPGAVVWDLFSGPGSMGLEALSRGASRALFVDRGRQAILALKQNIVTLGYGEVTDVAMKDVFRFRPSPKDPAPNIIFFDPPFPLVEREAERIEMFLVDLGQDLDPEGLIMYRSPASHVLKEAPEGLRLADSRVKGVNALHFLRLP